MLLQWHRHPVDDQRAKAMSPLPAPRRIVTSDFAVPESLRKVDDSKPAVEVVTEEIPLVSELDGQWFDRPVFTQSRVPTSKPAPTSA